jgi:hypothetical protein
MSDTSNVDNAANQQNNQQNDQQNNQQQKTQNNNGNNGEDFNTIWDAPENKQQDNQQNNQNNNNNQQQQVDPNAANVQLDNYIKGLNFNEGVDMEQIAKDIGEGNLKSLQAALGQVAANSYKRSLIDTHKIVQESVKRAVDEAVSKSRGQMGADMAVREMQRVHTFTKDKRIAPVAEAALKQFISKGQDVETAVANVGKYFSAVGDMVGPKNTKQRNQGFNNSVNNGNNSNQNGDDSGDLDFMSILTQDKPNAN